MPRETCPEVAPLAATAHRLALAVCLTLAPAPSLAAPAASERDLAYERAVQAEEAGDHAAAAGHYERAFQLTAPAETGPRLLFLRSSVAARLRAFDGSRDARAHLCPARALLRDHLGVTADLAQPARATDPSLAERDSLARIERQLASIGTDCAPEPDPVPTPPEPARDQPATRPPPTSDSPAEPPPASEPVGPEPPPQVSRPRITRDLQISGGAFLGVGAAGFAIMTAGIIMAADARKDGVDSCYSTMEACDGSTSEIRNIRKQGSIANGLIPGGAALGGLGLVTGIVMLAVSKRAGRPRVAVTPAPTGLTVSARF
jgi:hypothetical protein